MSLFRRQTNLIQMHTRLDRSEPNRQTRFVGAQAARGWLTPMSDEYTAASAGSGNVYRPWPAALSGESDYEEWEE